VVVTEMAGRMVDDDEFIAGKIDQRAVPGGWRQDPIDVTQS
jgi:hypothetical protein